MSSQDALRRLQGSQAVRVTYRTKSTEAAYSEFDDGTMAPAQFSLVWSIWRSHETARGSWNWFVNSHRPGKLSAGVLLAAVEIRPELDSTRRGSDV